MANKKYSDEQIAATQALIDDGASTSEALRQTGVPRQTWYIRKRKANDPTPNKGRPKSKVNTAAVTDEQLLKRLTPIAVAPALPAQMWLRCDYCADHFATQGPEAAAKLIELSHDKPELRKMLEDSYRWLDQGAWAMLFAGYVGVPIAHHLAPDFVYKWAMMFMGLPPRDEPYTRRPPAHAHAQAASNNEKPSGFEALDDEQLAAAARAAGIDLSFDIEGTVIQDATTAETPDTSEQPEPSDDAPDAADTAAPSADAVADAAPDSHTVE